MSNNNRRPILYNGEIYSEPITKNSGGGSKEIPYSYEEARTSVLKDISNARETLLSMPQDARLPNEVILSLILQPEFSAKSYYPDSLFDLEVERFGLKEIGSRVWREQSIILEEENGYAQEVTSSLSKMFFVRTTEASLDRLEQELQKNSSTLTKKFQTDIRKISSLGFLSADQQIVGLSEEWVEGTLEAVLHPFGIDRDIAIQHFLERIQSVGVDNNEIRHKTYDSGITFICFKGNRQVLNDISGYNPLRTVHPLEMRTVPDFSRGTTVKGGPKEPEFTRKPDIIVGVIDGGVNIDNPFLKNYIEAEDLAGGTPSLGYLEHGTQVSGTVLYGPLNNFKNDEILPEPSVSVKSFRVLGESSNDPELYDVIDAIEEIVPNNPNISVYNISLGPRGPILDDSISRFTYSCDMLSYHHQVLFCVAVGNDGELQGYDRIQAPSDSVNCVGVGAFTIENGNYIKAPYSSIGPGREGCKMKPDIMAFGGCQLYPIHLISNETGERVWNLGTSFSSPIVAGIAGSLIGESNGVINSYIAKALIIHSAKERMDGHKNDMGHGVIQETADEILNCSNNSYTLIYHSEIETGKYAEFLIPWENIDQGKAQFRWTVAVLTDIDHLSSDDYTSSAVEVVFYPNRNKYTFKNTKGKPLDGKTKLSEVVDIEKDRERAEYLLANGWEQSKFPKSDSVQSPYKTEAELRADLKWDTLDTRIITKMAHGIDEPAFHIHGLARGNRTSNQKVKFALILTVETPKAEIDLYSIIMNKYSALLPLEVNVKSEISVNTDLSS